MAIKCKAAIRIKTKRSILIQTTDTQRLKNKKEPEEKERPSMIYGIHLQH